VDSAGRWLEGRRPERFDASQIIAAGRAKFLTLAPLVVTLAITVALAATGLFACRRRDIG